MQKSFKIETKRQAKTNYVNTLFLLLSLLQYFFRVFSTKCNMGNNGKDNNKNKKQQNGEGADK